MNDYKEASIDTIDGGSAKTAFDFELKRAIADCMDTNKDPNVKRKVVLTAVLLTAEDYSKVDIKCQVHTKLVPDKPVSDSILIAPSGQAFVNNAKQMNLAEMMARGEVHSYDGKTGEVNGGEQ